MLQAFNLSLVRYCAGMVRPKSNFQPATKVILLRKDDTYDLGTALTLALYHRKFGEHFEPIFMKNDRVLAEIECPKGF